MNTSLSIIVVIAFLAMANCSQFQIYGVRWFLGDHFSYSSTVNPNNYNSIYYVLSFNSDGRFSEDVYVQLQNDIYTCSHRVIEVQHTDNHEFNDTITNNTKVSIYRCNINRKLVGEIPYSIFTSKPIFSYSFAESSRQVTFSKTTIFSSKFRSVFTNTSNTAQSLSDQIFCFGDWGQISKEVQQSKGYIPILQSLMKDVEANPDLKLILFLGDIAYDLIGDKYISMLKYIEPLTSRMAFMVTPGNHDQIFHEDCFQLFIQTFLSPNWSKNFNFYYSMVINDIILISYNPDDAMYDKNFTGNVNAFDLMKNQLFGDREKIRQKYSVIVFSHYPIYCSDPYDSIDSCQKNKKRLKNYIEIFEDIGIDLFISGHLHAYERTHEICEQQNKIEIRKAAKVVDGIEFYDSQCPIYVVDGSSGNDYYVQMKDQYKQKQFSSSLVYGTGYGILSLNYEDRRNSVTSLKYEHYKMMKIGQKESKDVFIKQLPQHSQQQANTPDPSTTLLLILQITVFVLLFLLLVCCLFNFKCLKRIRESKKTSVIELVEEPFQSANGSDKQVPQKP